MWPAPFPVKPSISQLIPIKALLGALLGVCFNVHIFLKADETEHIKFSKIIICNLFCDAMIIYWLAVDVELANRCKTNAKKHTDHRDLFVLFAMMHRVSWEPLCEPNIYVFLC